MNDDIVNAFLESTASVFNMMLGIDVTPGEVQSCNQMMMRHEVSGVIGLSGGLSGDVIVSFNEKVARLATGAMLGTDPQELDNEVVDAVGELTNMIAGAAKGKLEQYNMALALPTVIIGKGHRIGFKTGVSSISMPFDSDWGEVNVQVGLVAADAPLETCTA